MSALVVIFDSLVYMYIYLYMHPEKQKLGLNAVNISYPSV